MDRVPDKCPLCTTAGQPNYIIAAFSKTTLHTIFRYPIANCRALYTAVYTYNPTNGNAILQNTALARLTAKKEFPSNIEALSPDFCAIYNQSLVAEENGLDQICGPGYRKSLEFLVKDFLIKSTFKADAAKQEEVKKQFLGSVIKSFIAEDRIKRCAERATWLGNDQTHYLRKWVNKDVKDLKSLILITVNHFDMVLEADRYLAEMPEGTTS